MGYSIQDILQQVEVLEPQQVNGLQVFGLRHQLGNGLAYRTLDEALADQQIEVSEISEGGSVPTLKVSNRGNTMLFLMAGEQLIGAKQNRVLNASIMVAAQTELPIPVSCVEAGRWAYRSRQFGSSGTGSHSALRKIMTKQATESYASLGTPMSNQGEVWNEVSRKLQSHGSRSASSALEQVYADHGNKLSEVLKQLPAPEGCAGAVFAFGGRIAGVDLFDQPGTLAKLWAKLIRAYAIDALEHTEHEPVRRERVEAWLRTAAAAKAEPFKSPGLGEDIRLKGKDLVGATLVVQSQPVHLEMFADEPMKA
jgi:hypothetical protein